MTATATAPRPRRLLSRLYRGDTDFGFIASRKRWYFASLVIIVICLGAFVIRGFHFGVEFSGGTQVQISTGHVALTPAQVEQAAKAAGFPPGGAAQQVGSGATRSIVIKTSTLSQAQQADLTSKLVASLKIPTSDVSLSSVSATWGQEITRQAVIALIVFLLLVAIYLAVAFQWRMAVGALAALLHDLVVSAGIYALVGFEVTPSTVVGLLTILGFSLYDTVVVFDKIRENTRDLIGGSRMTYSEAANLAVNQTLMRSINTSVISLLPVAGLLFVGALLLGVGTIKDLALILFVGLTSGAYSSLFLAAPIVCDLTERQPAYRALARRVAARRSSGRRVSSDDSGQHGDITLADAGAAEAGRLAAASARVSAPAPAPRPGARPVNRSKGRR